MGKPMQSVYNAVGNLPIDGSNPQVFSSVLLAGPYSYFNDFGKAKTADCPPPPTYLKESEILYNVKTTKEEVLKGFEIQEEGGLTCVDKEILDKQKGVIMNLLKQVAKGIFTKQGFVRISLPVRIFEGRSMLDKILDAWRFAPVFLNKAFESKDPLERMKNVIAFAISGLHLSATHLKPFNPIIGETLQGGLGENIEIFCEHSSHHPPVTHFMMVEKSEKFRMTGRYNYKMKFSANSMRGKQSGKTKLAFKDGGEIVWSCAHMKLTGAVAGARRIYYNGKMKFVDRANNLKALIFFDYGNKEGIFFNSRAKGIRRDFFKGVIYNMKPVDPKAKKTKIKSLSDVKDIGTKICELSGSWLGNLVIDGKEYWSIDSAEYKPGMLWYGKNVLPSDWRYREDLLWLRRNNIELADKWKVVLEVQQRFDNANREDGEKKREKAEAEKLKQMLADTDL